MTATPSALPTATAPWEFSRSERSTDLARPFSRNDLAAASKSPSVSVRARFASIIPAPVAWRRAWTSLAVNDMGAPWRSSGGRGGSAGGRDVVGALGGCLLAQIGRAHV